MNDFIHNIFEEMFKDEKQIFSFKLY